jgi:hypothetical protein
MRGKNFDKHGPANQWKFAYADQSRTVEANIPDMDDGSHGRKKGLRAEAGKPDLVLLNSW